MSTIRKCQAKTFPCPAGDRCPGFQDLVASHNHVFQGVIRENHLNLPRALENTLCANSIEDVRDYRDLGENVLLKGTRVAYCERHGVYHRYDRDKVDGQMRKLATPLHRSIEDQGKGLSRFETQPIHELVNENLDRFGSQLRFEQEAFVTWRNSALNSPEFRALRLAAEQKRNAQRQQANATQPVNPAQAKAAQLKQDRAAIQQRFNAAQPVKTLNSRERRSAARAAIPLLVEAESLTSTQLMEFHVCYRKRKFDTQQEALNFIEPANTKAAPDNRKEAYKCPFCRHIHLGSAPKRVQAITTENLNGDAANRINAARSWRHYREKANAYALANNLVSVSEAFDKSLAMAA